MIISRSRKFIFAHVPKTGGISMRAALAPFADGQSAAHDQTTHETLPAFIARHPEMQGHFKFAFVRNPWDRLVSFYFNAMERLARTIPQMQSVGGFGGMLRMLDADADWLRDLHILRPQREFVRGEGGGLLADFVGRYEHLESDFGLVCRRAGIGATLPKKNVSSHGPYARYYDDWGKGFVAARYRDDIMEFDYAFEAAA